MNRETEDWVERERKAKSTMKLGTLLLFPFKKCSPLKTARNKHKKSILTSDLRPGQRTSPPENTLTEKNNYCERARD